MSDKPRAWPQVARAARDQAADQALSGMKALEPLLENERPVTESERIRRENKAFRALEKIAWLMQNQGAPIRPEDI
jgi:hypothetical protein